MTEYAHTTAPQAVSSQPAETSHPMAAAHIDAHGVTPQEIQYAIAESIRAGLAAAASEHTVHSGGTQLHPTQPQVTTITPMPQSAQYHVIQPSYVSPVVNGTGHPSAAHLHTPYQPFSSNPTQQSAPTQAQLTATTNNSFTGSSSATPASSPPSHAPSATQQPPSSQVTTPQQASPMSALTSPPQGSLNSGSFASHIQNVLAAVSGASHHSPQTPIPGTIQSQVMPPGSNLFVHAQPTLNNVAGDPASHAAPAQREPVNSKPSIEPSRQVPGSGQTADAANSSASNRALDRALNTAPNSALSPESATKPPPPPLLPPEKALPTEKVSVVPPDVREAISGISPIAPPQAPPILPSPSHGQSSGNELRPEPTLGVKQPEQGLQQGIPTRDATLIVPTLPPQFAPVIQPLPVMPVDSAPLPPERQQQQQTERLERLRDIQQISAAEREPIKPAGERLPRDGSSNSAGQSLAESREHTAIAIERIRESLIDRLTTIQSRIETTATERHRREDLLGPIDLRTQGRNNLVRPDPIHHDAKPSLITRLAERLQENQQPARGVRDTFIGISSALTAERARVRHIDSTSPLSGSPASSASQPMGRTRHDPERFSNVIDLLKRFSQRSINFQLLNKMDTSLERACLTVATGAALGFVGLEYLYRATHVVVLHTLGFLREQEAKEHSIAHEGEQTELEQTLARDLAEFASTELTTVGEQGFVVDLAGVVVSMHTETPLAKVTVNFAEFGTCSTDFEGRFLFPNIPLGTPYTISLSSTTHKLRPLVVTGVCGELEFLRIKVEKL